MKVANLKIWLIVQWLGVWPQNTVRMTVLAESSLVVTFWRQKI